MKRLHHLLLWAFLAFSSTVLGQIDSSGPQGIIDTVFSGLDTGKITTGLLADKTVSLYVDLKSYDGTIDNPISFDDAMTLPLVIRNMDMKGNIAPNEKFIAAIYEQHNRNSLLVPLVFDYNYNKIDDNAFADGLIDSSKNVWTDTTIAGKTAYVEKKLKATALNFNYGAGSTFRFMFDPRVYFTNRTKPTFLLVDFDDGAGTQKVAAFDTVTVTYFITGKHSITFYLPDLNSDVPERINISVFDFKPRPNRANNPDCAFMFKSDQTVYKWNTTTKIIGYDNNGDPIFGNVGEPLFMEALVSIQMGLDKKGGTKHQCLKKPLLFIDGIDFGYKDRNNILPHSGCLHLI